MQRAFLYGDLLFETMLAKDGRIPHIARHFRRLAHSAQILYLDLCGLNEEKFKQNSEHKLRSYISEHPESTLHRVRFVLSRKSGGYYLPDKNESEFDIQVEDFIPSDSEKTLHLGVFRLQQKAPGPLSNLKNGNALIYVMARIWGREHGYDDVLILNTNNEIIEASNSNIFWKKQNQWFTPPLSSGCVAGIGRELFMEANPVTETICSIEKLKDADACLLTNALLPQRSFVLRDE